jgi:hypothetical protein
MEEDNKALGSSRIYGGGPESSSDDEGLNSLEVVEEDGSAGAISEIKQDSEADENNKNITKSFNFEVSSRSSSASDGSWFDHLDSGNERPEYWN